MLTGFLSYAGPFNQEFRTKLLYNWKKELADRKVPFSHDLHVTNTLVDQATIGEWNLQGGSQLLLGCYTCRAASMAIALLTHSPHLCFRLDTNSIIVYAMSMYITYYYSGCLLKLFYYHRDDEMKAL